MQNNDNINLSKIYQALAQMMFELNIDFNQFEKTIKKNYVLISHNSCETIAQTSLQTGVDRRLVSLILKRQKQYIKPSSLQLILQQLKKATVKTDGVLNKLLETIMNRVAYGSTNIHSIIAQLLHLGYIKEMDTKTRLIKTTVPQDDSLHLLSVNIHKCISEFIVEKRHTENEIDYGLDNPNSLTYDLFKLYNSESN